MANVFSLVNVVETHHFLSDVELQQFLQAWLLTEIELQVAKAADKTSDSRLAEMRFLCLFSNACGCNFQR